MKKCVFKYTYLNKCNCQGRSSYIQSAATYDYSKSIMTALHERINALVIVKIVGANYVAARIWKNQSFGVIGQNSPPIFAVEKSATSQLKEKSNLSSVSKKETTF